MGITRIADTIYAFRFLKLLVTPWEKTNAYKLGIVDDKGKKLKKPETAEEKDAYNIFHKLVYNIKRLLNKLPLGQTRLASYAAALYLIKENTGLSEQEIQDVLDKMELDFDTTETVTESWIQNDEILLPGVYTLNEDFANPKTGEMIHPKGSQVKVSDNCEPVDTIFNTHIYEVTHIKTKQSIYVAAVDLER